MFLKIFSQEIKKTYKTMLLLLGLQLGVATLFGLYLFILGKAADPANENVNLRILVGLGNVGAYTAPLGIAVFLIIDFIFILYRFFKAVSTDEAYFTFSIPAKPSEQYFARLLVIYLWSFIALASTVLSAVIFVAFSVGSIFDLRDAVQGIFEVVRSIFSDQDSAYIAVMIIVEMVLSCVFIVAEYSSSVLIANRLAKRYKGAATVISVVIINYVLQAVLSTVFTLGSVFVANTNVGAEALRRAEILLTVIVVLTAALTAAFIFVGYKIMQKMNVQ
ncbi:MAG: hypothetical protein J6N93_04410 [Clostridia bacterium]|nr:hypothetical protein [Clostridia bacterium]